MDRNDDRKTSLMMEHLLNGKCPSENDFEYITKLLTEAHRIKPDKNNLINICTLYADIVGKCYLYALFYDRLFGDP